MRLVDLICPSCGATIKVNSELSRGICNYCGRHFLVDDEIKKYRITNGVQLGYQQEQGRRGAVDSSRDDLLRMLSMAIDPIKEIERAYGFYAQAEQRLRRFGAGDFAVEIVVTVLLHISIIPLVCLIVASGFAELIVTATGTEDSFAKAIMLLVFSIFAWLITVLITIPILYGLYTGKQKTKMRLNSQYSNAKNQYQKAVKRLGGKISFLPPDYRYSEAVESFYRYVNNYRANDLQQAINLYEEEMHRLRMENAQLAMLREAKRQSSLQAAQLAAQVGIWSKL